MENSIAFARAAPTEGQGKVRYCAACTVHTYSTVRTKTHQESEGGSGDLIGSTREIADLAEIGRKRAEIARFSLEIRIDFCLNYGNRQGHYFSKGLYNLLNYGICRRRT